MDAPVLLCTDGSDLAIAALRSAVALLPADTHYLVVAVMDDPDPTLVTGSGMAGGVMSAESYERKNSEDLAEANGVLTDTVAALQLDTAETRLLQGTPGPAICQCADEVGAKAIAVGSRGRGGFKRAMLGSVSDHVVRNASCTVLVSTAGD